MAARRKAAAKGKPKAKGAGPKRAKYVYDVAPDVQADLEEIVRLLPDDFAHVDPRRVVCFRSRGSTAKIYARIWSLPGIWQAALGIEAHYVIEVVERYDRQPKEEKEKTLLHELMHIPKTFSGALVPHNCFGKKINCDSEDRLHRKLVAARALEERATLASRALTPAARPSPGGGQRSLDDLFRALGASQP
jgi:predicted metallopeptidase